jgi:hypothetical protein
MKAIQVDKETKGLVIKVETEETDSEPEISFYNWKTKTHEEPSEGFAGAVREVMKEADGIWGWCDVKVTARLGELEGVAYLAQCSYHNEEEFKQEGGFYEDMVETAIHELQKKINRTSELIKGES